MSTVVFRCYLFWLFALAIICTLPVYGQKTTAHEPYILVNTLNDNSGLPQNSIIAQYIDTSSGMLWLATFDGLVRYNGISTKSYNHSSNPALHTNKMVCLFKTFDGQVFGMNTRSQLLKIAKQDVQISNQLDSIWKNYALFVWFKGVLHSLDQIGKLGTHAFGKDPYYPRQESWTNESYNYYVVDLPGNRFAVTTRTNELLVYKDKEIVFSSKLPIQDTRSSKIFYKNGFLYVLDDQLRGACFKVLPDQLQPVPIMPDQEITLLQKQFPGKAKLFYQDINDQLIWQIDKMVYVLSPDRASIAVRRKIRLDTAPQSISNILYYDRHQTLFIGTTAEGLYVFRKNNFIQLHTDNPQININSNYAQLMIGENILRTNRGVEYDLASAKISAFRNIDFHSVWTPFTRDTAGSVYTVNDDSVSSFIPGKPGYRPIYGKEPAKNQTNNIKFIWSDTSTGRLWIMEFYKWGYLYKGVYYPVLQSDQKIPTPCYATKKGSSIYLATDKGMMILDEVSGRYHIAPGTKDMEVRFVAMNDDNRYCWIGTYGDGFGAYDPARDTTRFFPRDPRSFLSAVHLLAEDQRGYVWATTNKGLFRLRKQQLLPLLEHPELPDPVLYFDYFDRQDGLFTNEFNGGAQPIYSRWKGNLLFSTINGIAVFDPYTIADHFWTEPLFIDYAQTATRSYIQSAEDSTWQFSANERIIRWFINKACWHNPYALRFEYRLDKEKEWHALGGVPVVIQLETLAAGKHVLYVRNYAGASSNLYVEQQRSFFVAYYWYETWWGILLILLGLFAIGMAMVWWRTKDLLQQKKRLTKTVAERTDSLNNSVDEILMLKDANDFKTTLVRILVHDILVPASSIKNVSEILYKGKDKIDAAMLDRTLQGITMTASNLMLLSEQLIQWTRIQENMTNPTIGTCSIRSKLEEVEKDMAEFIRNKQNRLINDIDPDLHMTGDPEVISHLLFNLLNNANNYTNEGVITAKAEKTGQAIMLTFHNSGYQMPDFTIDPTFRRFSDSSLGRSADQHDWGLTFQIIFDLLQLLDGVITYQSSEEAGTEVKVTIPQ